MVRPDVEDFGLDGLACVGHGRQLLHAVHTSHFSLQASPHAASTANFATAATTPTPTNTHDCPFPPRIDQHGWTRSSPSIGLGAPMLRCDAPFFPTERRVAEWPPHTLSCQTLSFLRRQLGCAPSPTSFKFYGDLVPAMAESSAIKRPEITTAPVSTHDFALLVEASDQIASRPERLQTGGSDATAQPYEGAPQDGDQHEPSKAGRRSGRSGRFFRRAMKREDRGTETSSPQHLRPETGGADDDDGSTNVCHPLIPHLSGEPPGSN